MNTEPFTTTIINIILSGDVGQARAWAWAHPETVAALDLSQRSRIGHACRKWGIPNIL